MSSFVWIVVGTSVALIVLLLALVFAFWVWRRASSRASPDVLHESTPQKRSSSEIVTEPLAPVPTAPSLAREVDAALKTREAQFTAPQGNPAERLEELRAFFGGITTPNAADWSRLCFIFHDWLAIRDLRLELDYARQHLASWPDALRVGPYCWAFNYDHALIRSGEARDRARAFSANLNVQTTRLSDPPPQVWTLVRTLDLMTLTDYDAHVLSEVLATWNLEPVLRNYFSPSRSLGLEQLAQIGQWPHADHLTRIVVSPRLSEALSSSRWSPIAHPILSRLYIDTSSAYWDSGPGAPLNPGHDEEWQDFYAPDLRATN